MRKKKRKSAISDNTTPCHRLPDVCLFCSYMYEYVCDALSKGHSVCARARRNHHIIHSIPVATSTRLFFFLFFSLRSFVTLSLSFLDQTHALFSSTHTYIHSYIRCVQEGSLSRTKIFSFFLLHTHTYIHTEDGEKIAAGRKRRTRLSILRNNDVWARVYTQANVLFLLLT
jgi:hypothetical protein